jgi:hypothetical protein
MAIKDDEFIGKPSVPSARTGILPTTIQAFGQGLTYGSADEAIAAIESMLPGETYQSSLAKQRAEREAMRRNSPFLYPLAELAGGIASPNPFGKLRYLEETLGTTGKLLTSAGEGAVTGFTEGVLSGEPGQRISQGAESGAIGAVTAPALRGVTDLFMGGVDVAKRAFRPDAQRVASQEILRGLREANLTPTTMRSVLQANPPGMPAPFAYGMGQQGQMLTERAALGGGRAADIVIERANEITSGYPERVRDAVEIATGPREFTDDIIQQYKNARNVNANELYGAARARRVVQDDNIVKILNSDPLLRRAYQQAQLRAKREKIDIPDLFDKNGDLIPGAYPNVAALDYTIRAIRTSKEKAYNSRNPNAPGIDALFTRLDRTVKEAVPEYQAASKQFFDDSRLIELAETGKKILTMNQSSRMSMINKLSPDEQLVVRRTALDALYNKLARMDDASMGNYLLNKSEGREALAFLGLTPEIAAQAAMRIRQERDLARFAGRVDPKIGSATARREAAKGEGEDQVAAAQAGTRFVLGGTGEKASMILNFIRGKLQGMTPDTRARMAEMLMAVDPKDQARVLQELAAEERKLLQDAMQRAQRSRQASRVGARVPGLLTGEE